MNDIFKSIKASLYDRAVSPLFGAYVTAWFVWNYKFIIIVFSDESIKNKLRLIDKYFDHFNYDTSYICILGELISGVIIPTIITLAYIYIYPFFSRPVYEHSLKKQQELRKIKQKEENNRLLSVEQSRELRKQIAMLESERDKETENYSLQIRSLTETITNLENQKVLVEDSSKKITKSEALFENSIRPPLPAILSEYIDEIEAKLESMPDGDFQLSDLFSKQTWSDLDTQVKHNLGKGFKNSVKNNYFSNIIVIGKGSSNQIIYTKTEHSINNISVTSDNNTVNVNPKLESEFQRLYTSGELNDFLSNKDKILENGFIAKHVLTNFAAPLSFGMLEPDNSNNRVLLVTPKGREFIKWVLFKVINKSHGTATLG